MKISNLITGIAIINTIIVMGFAAVAFWRTPSINSVTDKKIVIATTTQTPASNKKTVRIPITQPVHSTNPPELKPTPDNRCIVIVDGFKYDMTSFRTIHQGGDIFQCGTDMSAIFWGQHNTTTLSKMQKYRI